MSKKYTLDDIGDLALYGNQSQQALQEFCDILNETGTPFSDRMSDWTRKYESAGADDTASKEAQMDVLVTVLKNNQKKLQQS